jgi:hypothetical protein
MTHLYERQWFIDSINWLRDNSPWFEKYGYGKSKNIEDFVRNPFEVMRDTCFPFVIQNVKAYSLLIRCGYIPYKKELENKYYAEIENNTNVDANLTTGSYFKIYDGKSLGFNINKWRIIDIVTSKWITKYPNAAFMFQILLSMKWYIIPIPFISMGIRFTKARYFQLGFGWSPQWKNYANEYPGDNSIQAVMSGKFRIGYYNDELEWNPGSEVYGFWEGTV